jgi:5-methyltetrahydropteroyltriglutamate--homocysteine methyltransferase
VSLCFTGEWEGRDGIKTTHVGSLPRSQAVVDQIFRRENGEAVDGEEFDRVMAGAVADAVKRQRSAGISIVSDGEMSKISYATYVKDRYEGFGGTAPGTRRRI